MRAAWNFSLLRRKTAPNLHFTWIILCLSYWYFLILIYADSNHERKN